MLVRACSFRRKSRPWLFSPVEREAEHTPRGSTRQAGGCWPKIKWPGRTCAALLGLSGRAARQACAAGMGGVGSADDELLAAAIAERRRARPGTGDDIGLGPGAVAAGTHGRVSQHAEALPQTVRAHGPEDATRFRTGLHGVPTLGSLRAWPARRRWPRRGGPRRCGRAGRRAP